MIRTEENRVKEIRFATAADDNHYLNSNLKTFLIWTGQPGIRAGWLEIF